MLTNLESRILNINKKKIAEITLIVLKKKLWKNISLDEIKKKSKIKSFDRIINDKKDILKILNHYFDYKLSKKSNNIEVSSNKDMLFEVLMLRFDILQIYRKQINHHKRAQDEILKAGRLFDMDKPVVCNPWPYMRSRDFLRPCAEDDPDWQLVCSSRSLGVSQTWHRVLDGTIAIAFSPGSPLHRLLAELGPPVAT